MRIKQAYKNDVETIKNTLGYEFINHIPTPYYTEGGTIDGVTISINKNKSLFLNGTSTKEIFFHLHHRLYAPTPLNKNKYILNGIGEELTGSGVKIVINKTNPSDTTVGVNLVEHYAEKEEFLHLEEDTECGIYLYIPAGVTFTNTVIRPMLRPSYVVDKTYREYVKNVNNNSNYIDFKDKITINEQNCILHMARVINGIACITGYALKQSSNVSHKLFTINDSKYKPFFTHLANVGSFSVATDPQKIANISIDNYGNANMWNNSAMGDNVYFYFNYPLM